MKVRLHSLAKLIAHLGFCFSNLQGFSMLPSKTNGTTKPVNSCFSLTASLTTNVHQQVLRSSDLWPHLQAVASTMEAINMAPLDYTLPPSSGVSEKFFQRWKLKTDWVFGQTYPVHRVCPAASLAIWSNSPPRGVQDLMIQPQSQTLTFGLRWSGST